MPFLFSRRNNTASYSSVPLDDHVNELEITDPETDDEILLDEQNVREITSAENPHLAVPFITLLRNNSSCCNYINGFLAKHSVGVGIFVSLLALITFSSVLSGVGYYSVFVKKPAPYIDKSYHAFSIPNHEVSRNFDAFRVARSKNSSHSFLFRRHRRSVNYDSHLGESKLYRNSYLIPDQKYFRDIPVRLSSHLSPGDEELLSNDVLPHGYSQDLPFSRLDLHKRSLRDRLSSVSKRSSDMLTVRAYQYHVRWKMQVVFMATGNGNEPEHEKDNIFTKERLQTVHNIEKMILDHPEFKDFCFKDVYIYKSDPAVKSINGCAPLNSLMTYFFPSQDAHGKFHYDGLGSNMVEIESAIKLAMTSDHFYYFVDEKVNRTYHKSRLLRTEVLFGAPLKGYSNPFVKSKEQTDKFKSFVIKYIDILSKVSTDKVQVLYGGNEIFDYEVDYTFWNDLRLAIISGVSIAVFMLILTSSLWLTLWGITSICLSFPLAFFFYRVVCGIRALGILNGVAAFVIIGIGVDDVFVFVNIFRQSNHDLTTFKRIKYTLITAGKATFFTSFTTAAAFAANIASSIPAVHQFGLFMSLIVACCWVTVVLIMPPALFIWQHTFYRCENYITSCFSKPMRYIRTSVLDLPVDIVQFILGNNVSDQNSVEENTDFIGQAPACSQTNNEVDDDDDDLPLLMLEDPMEYYFQAQEDGDVPLLTGDVRSCQQVSGQSGTLLQSCVYHLIARPVVKVRWIILVTSVLFLVATIALAVFLHPATKPPQIFNKDTNLQKVLNLKANLSVIDDISCSKCSAVYDVGETDHRHIPIPVTYAPNVPTGGGGFTVKPKLQPVPFIQITDKAKHITNPSIKTTENPGSIFPPHKVTFPKTSWKSKLVKTTQSTTEQPTMKSTTQTAMKPTTHAAMKPITQAVVNPTTRAPVKLTIMTTESGRNKKHSNTEHQTTKPLIITPEQRASESRSVPLNVDLCENNDCSRTQDRPLLETGATVYVVLGIKGIDRSGLEVGHVLDESSGKVEFDPDFSNSYQLPLRLDHADRFGKLCRICKLIASHTELIRNGSAQCFPSYILPSSLPQLVPDCRNLPKQAEVFGRLPPAHSMGGLNYNNTALLWWAFAFESTTSKGQSYFEAFKQYLKWEKLIQEIKDTELKDSPHLGLNSMFQTSEFWEKVAMEVVAVNSAIYGLVLSLVICLAAVAIFTGHVALLFIIFISIVEMICLVLGIFYLAGWEIGGVEAVSLSILVGSSVDYCMHLVEGYLYAGNALPSKYKENKATGRQWRTKAALSHIGVSIISSALTTIVASIPLTQTIIQPFAKFGQIVAINSTVCIIYSLTVCTSLLATIAPAYFVPRWKSYIKAVIGVILSVGVVILALFISSKAGVFIPSPNGDELFG